MLDGVYVVCQDQNILRFLKLYIYESKYLFVCLSVVCSLTLKVFLEITLFKALYKALLGTLGPYTTSVEPF